MPVPGGSSPVPESRAQHPNPVPSTVMSSGGASKRSEESLASHLSLGCNTLRCRGHRTLLLLMWFEYTCLRLRPWPCGRGAGPCGGGAGPREEGVGHIERRASCGVGGRQEG